MRPGRLRQRVLFEEPGPIDLDSDGARVETWVPVFAGLVSTEIVALSGRELIAAQAVQSKVSARMKVRFHPAFKARMRGTHRDTIYNIEAVLPDPKSGVHYLTLLCSSGVNEGD